MLRAGVPIFLSEVSVAVQVGTVRACRLAVGLWCCLGRPWSGDELCGDGCLLGSTGFQLCPKKQAQGKA